MKIKLPSKKKSTVEDTCIVYVKEEDVKEEITENQGIVKPYG